jgi:hypothetical protein
MLILSDIEGNFEDPAKIITGQSCHWRRSSTGHLKKNHLVLGRWFRRQGTMVTEVLLVYYSAGRKSKSSGWLCTLYTGAITRSWTWVTTCAMSQDDTCGTLHWMKTSYMSIIGPEGGDRLRWLATKKCDRTNWWYSFHARRHFPVCKQMNIHWMNLMISQGLFYTDTTYEYSWQATEYIV